MRTNVFREETHITEVDSFALKASRDKMDWTFTRKRPSYLPGRSTTPSACQHFSLVHIFSLCEGSYDLWALQPHPLPPAHHHPHADLDYEHTRQTKTHLSYSSSVGKAIKAFECQRFGLESRLWDATLGKLVNISEPHFTWLYNKIRIGNMEVRALCWPQVHEASVVGAQ